MIKPLNLNNQLVNRKKKKKDMKPYTTGMQLEIFKICEV